MNSTSESKLTRKITAVLFGLISMVTILFISMNFLDHSSKEKSTSFIVKQNSHRIWTALNEKKYYLQSKSNLYKYSLDDSTYTTKWVEYFSPNDSIEGRVVNSNKNRHYNYILIDKKHQLVTGVKIKLDSIDPSQTHVFVSEQSLYLNPYTQMYLNTFYPNTALDFEKVKLENTLSYMDSTETTNPKKITQLR